MPLGWGGKACLSGGHLDDVINSHFTIEAARYQLDLSGLASLIDTFNKRACLVSS